MTIFIPQVPNYRVLLFGPNKIFFGKKIVCSEMKSLTNMLTICEYASINILLIVFTQPSSKPSCRSDESHPTDNTTEAIVMLSST